MAKEKAEIEASLGGTDKIVDDVNKINSTFSKVGQTVASGVGGALKSVGSSLLSVASDGLRAAGVFQSINLASAVEDAKRLDATTARLGQSAGRAGDSLKEGFEKMERSALTTAPALADISKSLAQATYDAKGSTEAIGGLAEAALAMGREVGDELPLAVALRNGLGVIGDTTTELGRLRDVAERVGTIGGPKAFYDTMAALGPMLEGVATKSDESKAKIEALIAVLGKGLAPSKQKEVAAGALQAIRSKALDIERVTGRQVLDDNNQLIDPTKNLQDLKRIAQKRFGGNEKQMRRALMNSFGDTLGLAIYRTDLSQVDQVAASAKDTGKNKQDAEAFRKTKEAKRIEADIVRQSGMRQAGEAMLGVHDKLVNTLGVPGAVGTELVGGNLALKALPTIGKGLMAGTKAVGAGTAATALGVTASFAAPAIGVLADVGEDRDVMGAKYLNQHAMITGQGLANRAVREGDLTGAYMATKGDAETQKALLIALEKIAESNKNLPADLAAQIKGLQLQVRPPPKDPTENRGN